MEHNIMWHVLGWSIKTCGSFLKYVVLVSKTVTYIFNKWKVYHHSACRRPNSSLVLLAELVKLFCSNYWQNSRVTAAVHYFHYNSHHHFHYHCKGVVTNRALIHTHSHLLTLTHTQSKKGHSHRYPPTSSQKKVTPTHTYLQAAKKRSQSLTPTRTQPNKVHIRPHPPTHSQQKVIPTHTHPDPEKKGQLNPHPSTHS